MKQPCAASNVVTAATMPVLSRHEAVKTYCTGTPYPLPNELFAIVASAAVRRLKALQTVRQNPI
jgi:hypothetical protein